MEIKNLYLRDDEQIAEELAPVIEFRRYLSVRWFLVLLAVFVAAAGFLFLWGMIAPPTLFGAAIGQLPLLFVVFIGIDVAVSYGCSRLAFGKRYYWITTHRVVIRCGTFRYRLRSYPHETNTDIALTHSFLEWYAGVFGIRLRGTAGSFSMGGIPSPEAVYLELSGLIKDRRRKEGLVF